jgi:hypothetical protein
MIRPGGRVRGQPARIGKLRFKFHQPALKVPHCYVPAALWPSPGATTDQTKGESTAKRARYLRYYQATRGLLRRAGWQPHSVRGFLSGTVGKKMGLTVVSTKGEDGERSYVVKAWSAFLCFKLRRRASAWRRFSLMRFQTAISSPLH